MTPEERAAGFFADAIAQHALAEAIREHIADEREACAKECRAVSGHYAFGDDPTSTWNTAASWAAEECADRIRNRKR